MTVGKGCLLRSTVLEDEVLLGDRCILLEGSVVETHSILAPGSVVPPGRLIPSGQLWGGNPARFVRDLTKDEVCPADASWQLGPSVSVRCRGTAFRGGGMLDAPYTTWLSKGAWVESRELSMF